MPRIKPAADKMLAITLVKSRFGRSPVQRECIKALGLSKIRQVVKRHARPEIMGLIYKIGFLLHVEEIAQ
jgi:large subunit ribosomal protein L30